MPKKRQPTNIQINSEPYKATVLLVTKKVNGQAREFRLVGEDESVDVTNSPEFWVVFAPEAMHAKN